VPTRDEGTLIELDENMNKNSQLVSMRILKLPALVLAVTMLGLILPGTSIAGSTITVGSVTVDGIKTGGEYTGADSGKNSIMWWNDHNSIYTRNADPANMNDLFWEINEVGTDDFSLNVFFEVPTKARRMIWKNGCTYDGGGVGSCGVLDPDADQAYLEAYLDGSHHGDVKMDYGTQTGRDKDKDVYPEVFSRKWQDVDADGLGDDLTWKTSREYLVEDTGMCSISECLKFDMTASIEVMWTGYADKDAALVQLARIDNMQLHLSDEARGLPDIPEIPVPAAFWLFGTALIGFIGISRRTSLS